MMELSDEIEGLKEEDMTDSKFWGMLAMNDDEAFDYGRDSLKEGTYENQISLPYE